MSLAYKLTKFYDKFLSKKHYYLIGMTIYHIEILFFITLLGLEYNTHTFLPMITPEKANQLSFLNYNSSSLSTFTNMFSTIIILLIDLLFLYILKDEIKTYENQKQIKFFFNLSNKKILIIEAIVFSMSIGNPFVRAILYFLSFNTIQIYIIYRFLFNPKYTFSFSELIRVGFTLGSYISIISLLIHPIIDLIEIAYFVQVKL